MNNLAYGLPSIPDNKLQFYRDKLFREVSNLFEWEGLPAEIPTDYLERALIGQGRVMFFYDSNAYGYMALQCGVRGFNLYNQPTEAFAVSPNDSALPMDFKRTIIHKYDENIDLDSACVLINNMYNGESLNHIIEHYAYRMALVQQAFDTNCIWQNIPVIVGTNDNNIKLTIEKLFSDIMSGKPWVLVDKMLMNDNKIQAEPIAVPFLLDQLYDVKNEIYNEFRMTIGIDAPGADKKERLLVDEVNSNRQITETCLEIMLSQRKIACEEIKKVFGLDVNVKVRGGEKYGPSYNGIEGHTEDEEL